MYWCALASDVLQLFLDEFIYSSFEHVSWYFDPRAEKKERRKKKKKNKTIYWLINEF